MTFTDLPCFTLLRSETFGLPAKEGEFLANYPDFAAYPTGATDTSRRGTYRTDNLSVANGELRIHCHTVDGKPGGAVPYFKHAGITYGRYQLTLRSDSVKGYKAAIMLWPCSDRWNDGEIDFPEGNLNGTAAAFSHYAGTPIMQAAFPAGTHFTYLHTYAVEWLPARVTFFVDGKPIGINTDHVPCTPMRLTLQVETNIGGAAPTPADDGVVFVQEVALWQYTGPVTP